MCTNRCYLLLIVLLLLPVFAGANPMPCKVHSTSLFTENWEGENVGDNADELISWQHEPAYGEGGSSLALILADVSWPSGKFLCVNPPNPPPWGAPASMGICTKSSYAAPAPSSILSIKSKVLLNPGDGGGAGVIGFARPGDPLYGYGLAISRADDGAGGFYVVLEIHEFNGSLSSVGYGYHIEPIDPTDAEHVHTYELRASFGSSSIDFEVYWDNTHVPELDAVDLTPVSFSGNAIFSLAANGGQKVYFDDFVAAEEPIPGEINDGGGAHGLDGDPLMLVGRPCPFATSAALWFRLPHKQVGRLEIFDARGNRVRLLREGEMDAGVHLVEWNGRGPGGNPVTSGVYFARLSAGGRIRTQTLVRIK